MSASEGRQTASLKVFTTLFKAQRSLSECLARRVPQPPILQGSGFPILEALLHRGPLTQKDLSVKILRTTGNISQALDKLEQAGLISRQPGADRRSHRIELTAGGRQLIEEVFPQMAGAITAAMQSLSPEELGTLALLLKKLGTSLPLD